MRPPRGSGPRSPSVVPGPTRPDAAIDLGADLVLRNCAVGDPIRESPYPLELDGNGHSIRQTCFEKRVLRQDGTGYLGIHDVRLSRGGSDGPGAALTSRGEISLADCEITQNLAEEPGGGVFSMRRVTVHRCHINGNLANDDGGAIYARRGGVQVYDSVLSNNLVDGSGGAIGSTGDILVVRSMVDGNTTDGDGGALYADEDGDVTVDRLPHRRQRRGRARAARSSPLDGDVAVVGSTLNGNRADDRGGAISGEADVLVVNSNVARNLAVAHAGGGIWARGNLTVVNSTITQNYAEGEGGGILAAGRTTVDLVDRRPQHRTGRRRHRQCPPARRLRLDHRAAGLRRASPATPFPSHRSCRVYESLSRGYNFYTEDSCELEHPDRRAGRRPAAGADRRSSAGLRADAVRRQPGACPDPERLVPRCAARSAAGGTAAGRLGRLGPGPRARHPRPAARRRPAVRHRRGAVRRRSRWRAEHRGRSAAPTADPGPVDHGAWPRQSPRARPRAAGTLSGAALPAGTTAARAWRTMRGGSTSCSAARRTSA